MRNAVFDQYQRWYPRIYQPTPVRIIDVNDETLKRIGQWPWPRTVFAELIRKLQDAGAVAISFDVLFAEEDRTSPKSMVGVWNAQGDVRERLLAIPDHDLVMVEALRRGRVTLGFAAAGTAFEYRESGRTVTAVSACFFGRGGAAERLSGSHGGHCVRQRRHA